MKAKDKLRHQKQSAVKRTPLLIDLFTQGGISPIFKGNIRKYMEGIRNRITSAKVFVLDDNAARYIANFVKEHPDEIAANQEFAIPCFEKMYIEFPYDVYFNSLHVTGNTNNPDVRVGYYFEHGTVYVLIRKDIHSQPATSMIKFKLHQPFKDHQLEKLLDTLNLHGKLFPNAQLDIDAFFWGGSHESVSEQSKKQFRESHSFEWWDGINELIFKTMTPIEAQQKILTNSAGELRTIIAMLLFLNRTRDVIVESALPPQMGFIGNKQKPYVRHNVISLKLNARPMHIVCRGHTGQRHRQHDVIAHFCHDKVARANGHRLMPALGITIEDHQPIWEEVGINFWICKVCHGKRWHRRQCKRGTTDIGKVKSSYAVTAD